MNLEAAVIGIALSGSRIALLDLDVVAPYHFADTRNRAIWGLIEDYKAKNPSQGLDPMLLVDKLPTITEARVDADYLLDCLQAAPVAAEALASVYADKLINESARRGLQEACTRGLQIIEAGGDASDAEAEVRELLNHVSTGSTTLVDNQACLNQITNFTTQQQPFTPTPWPELNDLLGGWKPGGLYIVGARPGAGKALALDTPIPTPTGWTTMGKIKVGDQVIGMDGKPTTVVAATEVMHGRPCYNITFNDGETITADAQHQWLTETRASRKATSASKHATHTSPYAHHQRQHFPGVVTTQEIAETVRCKDGRANHSLPDILPIDTRETDLPIDPYIFGYWLGDGTSRTPEITVWDKDADSLVAHMDKAGYYTSVHRDSDSCIRVRFSNKPIGTRDDNSAARLRALGVLQNKHIPAIYLRASEKQRLELLRGILDSDGYVATTGQMEYATVDKALADSVMELMRTLALRPTMKTKRVQGRDEAHSTAYLIHAMVTRNHMTLPRKADRLPERRRNLRRYITACEPVKSVPVRCIQVDNEDHMYLAGHTMVPTHNSILALQAALNLADTGHVYLASLEMSGTEIWGRIMAQVADVPGDAVTRRRWPTKDEQARMEAAAPILKQLPLHFDERANLTIGDFVATTRLLHREHGLKAAFVDYIGLINAAPGDRRQRWELIGEYTRTLKNLAKDLQIPVIAVAQLGRQAEARPNGELNLSDLRESGNIEQDANVVMLLSCPSENGVVDWTRMDVYVAKNREGRTGHVLLRREGDYSRLSHLGWTPDYQ
jgi:replicative DNA helicase|nr:MAG TPA: DnaB-like replicative helicase [Caudoviricetes sp.]